MICICIWTLLKHLTPFHTIGTTIVLVWYHKNYLSVDLIFSHSAHQRVVINSTFSNLTAVTSGVSQGTVLGPTLFIIFINNIHYSKIIATFCWWYKQVSSVNDADCLQVIYNLYNVGRTRNGYWNSIYPNDMSWRSTKRLKFI